MERDVGPSEKKNAVTFNLFYVGLQKCLCMCVHRT